MVDVVGRLRVEVADRVVADRREVDDGVEAVEVLALDVADVACSDSTSACAAPKVQAAKRSRVESDDLVAGPLEHGDQHGADVAVVTGDEYAHSEVTLKLCAALGQCPSLANFRPRGPEFRVTLGVGCGSPPAGRR